VTDQADVKAGVAEPPQKQAIKLALEIGPLAAFFIMTSYAGLYVATACFVPLTIAALLGLRVLLGHFPLMPLVTGFCVVVFGGLTLYMHDDAFIKMKPTILYTLFSIILFGGLAFGRSWLKHLMEDAFPFKLTAEGWRILTFRWACFFACLAVVNEIVWRTTSDSFWSGFKLFGVLPLTIVFTIAQIGLLKKHEASAN